MWAKVFALVVGCDAYRTGAPHENACDAAIVGDKTCPHLRFRLKGGGHKEANHIAVANEKLGAIDARGAKEAFKCPLGANPIFDDLRII